MNVPTTFKEVTSYGAGPMNDELTTPPLLFTDNKEIFSHAAGESSGREMNVSVNSSSSEILGVDPTDLMQIQGVFGENFLLESSMEPEGKIKEEQKEVHVIQKEEIIVPRRIDQINPEPCQRPKMFRSREIMHNRFMANQSSTARGCINSRTKSQMNNEVRSITQIIYSSNNQINNKAENPSTTMGTIQDDIRVKKIKRSIQSTCVPNTGLHQFGEVTNIPERYKLQEPKYSGHPYLPERNHVNLSEYPATKVTRQFPNVVHYEGRFFSATTSCNSCKNKMEHKLQKPGNWPPTQCSKCGGKCMITEWGDITVDTDDDDDIVCLGQFISAIPARRQTNNVNSVYNLKRVKMEPLDEIISAPSCRLCGGHHIRPNGIPYNADFCPQYGSMSNQSYTTWN